MCPLILQHLSDGPTVALTSHQEHAFAQFPSESLLEGHNFHGYPASPSSILTSSNSTQPAPSSNVNAAPAVPKPSRKRSRDDATLEEDISLAVAPEPASAPKWEPIYGEGMVLLNPNTGMAVSAESQTGTWYEEHAELQQAAAAPVSSRSIALQNDAAEISRKSQRLDTSAPGLDDIALSSMHQRLNGSELDNQHRTLHTGPSPPTEPLIDDATRLLGISWQRIDTDADMAPAVRGWTKCIDNQFDAFLHDSQMLMKSRSLNAYLVAATPVNGLSPFFYLFNEDLSQAQLVASSWEACLHNLRCTPINFEGSAPILAAARSSTPPTANPFTVMEGGVPLLQQALSQHSQLPTSIDIGAGLSEGVGMEIDS